MLVYDPYYDIKAVSNSSLRHINPEEGGSPALFKQHWDGNGPKLATASLEFGNLVHLAVLEPHLLNYQVDKTNTPDKIRDIVSTVFKNVKVDPFDLENSEYKPFENYYPAIMSACDEHNYGKTWKDETRINKVLENGGAYFTLLTKTAEEDGFVITKSQEERMDRCLAGLNNDKCGRKLIYMVKEEAEGQVKYFNEQEVTWEDEKYSFPLKGKIDRLRVDFATGEYTIIDLKTTAKNLAQFSESFETYHYARQMAAYEIAAAKWLSQKYPDLAFKPSHRHVILAVETKGEFRAAKFIIKRRTIDAGREEYLSLLDRLQHHFETGDWVNDYEYAKDGAYYI